MLSNKSAWSSSSNKSLDLALILRKNYSLDSCYSLKPDMTILRDISKYFVETTEKICVGLFVKGKYEIKKYSFLYSTKNVGL